MPMYRFEIRSPLTVAKASQRLSGLMQPAPNFGTRVQELLRNAPETTPLLGAVSNDSFRARPDSRNQNSFLPVVHGEILPSSQGTTVRVVVRLHLGVLVVLAALYTFGVLATASPEAAGVGSTLDGLICLVAATFIVAAGLKVGFYPEARRIRRTLEDALEASTA